MNLFDLLPKVKNKGTTTNFTGVPIYLDQELIDVTRIEQWKQVKREHPDWSDEKCIGFYDGRKLAYQDARELFSEWKKIHKKKALRLAWKKRKAKKKRKKGGK
jgi:hypothetical protein